MANWLNNYKGNDDNQSSVPNLQNGGRTPSVVYTDDPKKVKEYENKLKAYLKNEREYKDYKPLTKELARERGMTWEPYYVYKPGKLPGEYDIVAKPVIEKPKQQYKLKPKEQPKPVAQAPQPIETQPVPQDMGITPIPQPTGYPVYGPSRSLIGNVTSSGQFTPASYQGMNRADLDLLSNQEQLSQYLRSQGINTPLIKQQNGGVTKFGPGGQTTDGCPPYHKKNIFGQCVPETATYTPQPIRFSEEAMNNQMIAMGRRPSQPQVQPGPTVEAARKQFQDETTRQIRLRKERGIDVQPASNRQASIGQARKQTASERKQSDDARYDRNLEYAKATGAQFNYETGDIAPANQQTFGSAWGRAHYPALAQTMASMTPSGDIQAGMIGAETLVDMLPGPGQITAAKRLGEFDYFQPNAGFWGNTFGTLGLAGDVLNVGAPLGFTKIPGNAKQYIKGAYNTVATGESILPVAWKSRAVGLSQSTSDDMFRALLNSDKLSDAERALIVEYQHQSSPFTGRFGNVNQEKRDALNNIIKKYNLNVGNNVIATRRFNPTNQSLGATLEGNRLNFGDRPTSFSAGVGTEGYGSGAVNRIVIPNRYLRGMGDNFIANQYTPLSEDALKLLEQSGARDFGSAIGTSNQSINAERELIGTGLDFRRIGTVKNDIGGYDWIVKPKKNGGWLSKYQEGGVESRQGGYTDIPFNYNSAWGGQFAMGGSIPGSVGFTYARTQGAAPSEGPYAKKTMPSAQDGTKKQKEWLQSYLQSPKYKERLKKEFAGKDDAFIDNEVNARLNNLLNTKVNYVKSIGSEPGWISGLMVPKQYEGEHYDYKQKKFLPNKWSPDSGRGYDKRGHVYLESEYTPSNWSPSEGFETIPLHELGHAVDDGGYRIPLSTKQKIFNYTQRDPKSLTDSPNYRSNGMEYGYYNTPTEFINRIQPIRYLLSSEGLYDTRNKDFTEKDYNNMIKNKNINKNVHYQDVMKSLKGTPEQKKKAFIDLMNSIAMQDNTNLDVAENGMTYYQHGLDWKPKTISRNGSKTKKYYVGKSDIQGDGAFAKKDIQPGEHIGKAHRIIEPYVDYEFTELGHKHNHSENPNVQNVLIGDERHFVATKPIKKGEELTTNYRLQPDLEQPEDWKQTKKVSGKTKGSWLDQYK